MIWLMMKNWIWVFLFFLFFFPLLFSFFFFVVVSCKETRDIFSFLETEKNFSCFWRKMKQYNKKKREREERESLEELKQINEAANGNGSGRNKRREK